MRWPVFVLGIVLAAAGLWPHDGAGQVPAQEPLPKGRPLGEWRRDLKEGTPIIRERAVVALCEVGGPAVPILVDAIQDYDFNVRTLAILCLGRLGPRGKDVVPSLVRTLDDRDWIVRRYAAGALGLLEVTAVDAAPALARTAVADSYPEVRQAATFALGRLGPGARETISSTLRELSSAGADEAVRTRAAQLLRDMDKR